MFFKKKRFNTLSDIKKHIILTPLVFVLIIATLSIVVVTLVLDYKKSNQIELLIQKDKYNKKNILKSYISDVKYNSSASFDDIEDRLNRSVFEINGHIKALESNNHEVKFDDIKNALNSLERQRDIDFVVFNSNSFEILKGAKLISYLQTLTNSKMKTDYFKKQMLRNIIYMGDENLIYWLDNQKRDIRLSYFQKIESKNWIIGAFSKIDDMQALTRKTIENSIVSKSKAYENAYLWFYDYENGYVYNYYNKAHKIDEKNLLEEDRVNFSKYIKKDFEKLEDETYNFRKYQFLVAVKSFEIYKQIKQINNQYHTKLAVSITVIILIALFMIFLSVAFAKFVNTLFNRYNKRLETKNSLYKKWKERYELAIIASNDGLWDINLDTKEIFFSNRWLEMFGYKRGRVQTFDDWLDLIHVDDRPKVNYRFNEHLIGKTDHFLCEYRLRTFDNNYKWVFVRGKAFSNSTKKSNRMLMMSMDIDQSKKLTNELQNVELLVEMGKIVIFKWNNDDNLSVDYVSKSINSYGYETQEFNYNINYIDVIHEDDIKPLKQRIKKAIERDDYFFTIIYRVKDKKGNTKWVFNRTILLKDHFGKVTHLYGYINDITKMKMTEEELKQKIEDEVEKNVEKDRLLAHQSKLASMGEVLGSIAHQWRQPLNNINLLIHFIRDNYGNFTKEELHDSIKSAKVQIDYMSQTIDDFRNFYKPTKDKEIFDIKKSIEACIKIVKGQLEKANANIEVIGDDVKIHGYQSEFQQVVVNILNNASEAAIIKLEQESFNPIIQIRVTKIENNVKVTLKNNCGEVEQEILERMFEPYFTTKFEDQGTGIGLYMAKTIIEKNMNGKIEVTNIDKGVKFRIILPI
ncbi:PAS domain-containing protein [Malaciobacter marinus]|jgi:PAS domain S-box-containing protein|uniref:PAS domain-containing sensor histidine kinase n=1 Tax=Malaciobacter TaxID=2321114 RepID=UPI0009A5A9BF|nr:PAS domain-containing protein [Malaciobacter marinus]SKB68682.1 PAS domain S-box-containing protein [Malaciobacter marinus]